MNIDSGKVGGDDDVDEADIELLDAVGVNLNDDSCHVIILVEMTNKSQIL